MAQNLESTYLYMEKRILIVEDDTTLRHILADVMRLAGYTTIVASDGEEGVRLFGQLKPHVVIADIMLPHLDGFEMVRRMHRHNNKALFMFLSARSSSDDVVEGFKAGGHDYLRKPFSINELMVRIEALFARLNLDENNSLFHIGYYLFDCNNNTLIYDNTTRHLSSRESAILEILAKNMDNVVSSQQLLGRVGL